MHQSLSMSLSPSGSNFLQKQIDIRNYHARIILRSGLHEHTPDYISHLFLYIVFGVQLT